MSHKFLLQGLLQAQQSYLQNFFSALEIVPVELLLTTLLNCSGTIFFTGIGKSGIIAQKIAATLCSTGSKAFYIPAGDAMHGDLGIVTSHDIVIILSKSGESEELLTLMPYLRNKGAKLVGWVSNKNSRLERHCDLTIYLPVERELCPFDLAPTTSAAIQLIFGDILAVALMRAKNFSIEEYGENHPAGRIGKRISMRVKDLMKTGTQLPLCSLHDRVADILFELSNKSYGCIMIVDANQTLLGIFTDGDLRRALQANPTDLLQQTMENVMTQCPRTIDAQALAWQAMKAMEANPKKMITELAVVEKNKLIGLIRMHDLIQSGL